MCVLKSHFSVDEILIDDDLFTKFDILEFKM